MYSMQPGLPPSLVGQNREEGGGGEGEEEGEKLYPFNA